MAYFEKTVAAGRVKEVYRYQRPDRKKGKQIRRPKTSPTPERMAVINEILAEQKLRWTLNANFCENDLHLILTYSAEPDVNGAKKSLAKFLRYVRAYFKKMNMVCKYITATEFRNKRIHHHVILKSCDLKKLNELWSRIPGSGLVRPVLLDHTDQYAKLASYLIKETAKTFREKKGAFRKRWNESRNLIHPEPVVKKIKAKIFRQEPEAEPGAYIEPDSVIRGCWSNDIPVVGGLEFVQFTMIRMPEKKTHPKSDTGKNCRDGKME